MKRISYNLSAIALSLLSATAAIAAGEGEANLVINETEVPFSVEAMQSDWSGSESWASVNIYLTPSEEADAKAYSRFTLGFEFTGGQAGAPESRLMIIDDGSITTLFENEEGDGPKVMVDAFEVSGNELTISGSFEMTMGGSSDFGRTVDQSDLIPVVGTFSATLTPP